MYSYDREKHSFEVTSVYSRHLNCYDVARLPPLILGTDFSYSKIAQPDAQDLQHLPNDVEIIGKDYTAIDSPHILINAATGQNVFDPSRLRSSTPKDWSMYSLLFTASTLRLNFINTAFPVIRSSLLLKNIATLQMSCHFTEPLIDATSNEDYHCTINPPANGVAAFRVECDIEEIAHQGTKSRTPTSCSRITFEDSCSCS